MHIDQLSVPRQACLTPSALLPDQDSGAEPQQAELHADLLAEFDELNNEEPVCHKWLGSHMDTCAMGHGVATCQVIMVVVMMAMMAMMLGMRIWGGDNHKSHNVALNNE